MNIFILCDWNLFLTQPSDPTERPNQKFKTREQQYYPNFCTVPYNTFIPQSAVLAVLYRTEPKSNKFEYFTGKHPYIMRGKLFQLM